jgi:hypothetical protein
MITVVETENAQCETLSVDYLKCSSQDTGEYSYVDFSCSGTTETHLTATAKTVTSAATSCDKVYNENTDGDNVTKEIGGNVVVFGTLGRLCSNDDGEMVLENHYPCTEGMLGSEGGNFCASGQVCMEEYMCDISSCTGKESCTIEIAPVSISNSDDRSNCSIVEESMDLSDFGFSPSSLASYHKVEWTFSAGGLGCQWAVPDITLSCRNGGFIELTEELDYCYTQSDVITCVNPVPNSEEQREVVELNVWCYGNTDDQLVLEVESLSNIDSESVCAQNGMAIQGIHITRACGAFGSEDFEFVSDPSFCSNSGQVHRGTNLCYSGYLCTSGSFCLNASVGPVSADTSALSVANCIYAE